MQYAYSSHLTLRPEDLYASCQRGPFPISSSQNCTPCTLFPQVYWLLRAFPTYSLLLSHVQHFITMLLTELHKLHVCQRVRFTNSLRSISLKTVNTGFRARWRRGCFPNGAEVKEKEAFRKCTPCPGSKCVCQGGQMSHFSCVEQRGQLLFAWLQNFFGSEKSLKN